MKKTKNPKEKIGWKKKLRQVWIIIRADTQSFISEIISSEVKKAVRGIEEIIKETCDEKTMPRICNLDKDTIEEYIKTMPVYAPKIGEEYEVGFVRGETWGAFKIKKELLEKLKAEILKKYV